MTQEDKDLLLKDLSARLSYGVKIFYTATIPIAELKTINAEKGTCIAYDCSQWYRHSKWHIENIKPYLRPLSSMTEEERKEVEELIKSHKPSSDGIINNKGMDNLLFSVSSTSGYLIDWLNAHHFDYRGLIPKGLAIEAPEEMYK